MYVACVEYLSPGFFICNVFYVYCRIIIIACPIKLRKMQKSLNIIKIYSILI